MTSVRGLRFVRTVTAMKSSNDCVQKWTRCFLFRLYDNTVTLEQAMILKLKDQCPRCGISARFHRDDCEFSMQQLMFRELESADRGIIYFELLNWELMKKLKDHEPENV